MLHAIDRGLAHHRTQHDIALARIAARERGNALRELVRERIGDLLVADHALGRHADLALIRERTEHGGIDGLIEIRIFEHDQRRLAAQFEQAGLQVLRRQRRNDLADARGAREIHALHRRMPDQRIGDFLRILRLVRDDVDHAIRHAGITQRRRDQAVRGRAHFRCLEDDGVTARKAASPPRARRE